MNRAFSLLDVKNLDEERRIISGMASTPTPDRAGDIVDPLGAEFLPDLPLFMYHDSHQTVGRVRFGTPTAGGIPYTATIPKVLEEGRLRDRVDEAWQMLKYKLITGVSIGFRPFKDEVERLATGGLRFKKYELLELSIVPVPMNPGVSIEQIRAAAFGLGGRPAAARQAKPVVRLDSPAQKGRPIVYLGSGPGASSKKPGVVYLDTQSGKSSAGARKRVVYLR